ncbi:MAG: cupin domain-containing protein [Flavobacteriales bacterium]|nr:cupin domain-containing protein [Flavobacteriales bacterium]
MKYSLLALFIFSFSISQAQHCIFPEYKCDKGHNLAEAQPDGEFDNIKVKKLALDSLSSGFLIWVKKNVRPHRHEFHSENVYVIEGEGEMVVDKDTFRIKPGSYVFIPTNVVHSVTVDESKGIMKALSVQSPFFDGNDRVFVE